MITQNLVWHTRMITAITLKYGFGAEITTATKTRLALQLIMLNNLEKICVTGIYLSRDRDAVYVKATRFLWCPVHLCLILQPEGDSMIFVSG